MAELIFGFRGEDVFHISQIPKGQGIRCNCHLEGDSSQRLVAKRGPVNADHFARARGDKLSNEAIQRSNESALHKKAKEIISKGGIISLPSQGITDQKGFTYTIAARAVSFESSDVKCEVSHTTNYGESYRTDVVIQAVIKLLLEIEVYHACESTAKMQSEGKHSVEISVPLSLIETLCEGTDFDSWFRDFLLNDTTSKTWISHPLALFNPTRLLPTLCYLEAKPLPEVCNHCKYLHRGHYYCPAYLLPLGLAPLPGVTRSEVETKYSQALVIRNALDTNNRIEAEQAEAVRKHYLVELAARREMEAEAERIKAHNQRLIEEAAVADKVAEELRKQQELERAGKQRIVCLATRTDYLREFSDFKNLSGIPSFGQLCQAVALANNDEQLISKEFIHLTAEAYCTAKSLRLDKRKIKHLAYLLSALSKHLQAKEREEPLNRTIGEAYL